MEDFLVEIIFESYVRILRFSSKWTAKQKMLRAVWTNTGNFRHFFPFSHTSYYSPHYLAHNISTEISWQINVLSVTPRTPTVTDNSTTEGGRPTRRNFDTFPKRFLRCCNQREGLFKRRTTTKRFYQPMLKYSIKCFHSCFSRRNSQTFLLKFIKISL